jgi:hypothetical protein
MVPAFKFDVDPRVRTHKIVGSARSL